MREAAREAREAEEAERAAREAHERAEAEEAEARDRRFRGAAAKARETRDAARSEKDLRFLADRASAIARARDVVLVLSADGDGGGAGLLLGRQDKCAPWGSRRRSAALYAFLEADDGGLADFHEFHAAFGSDVAAVTGRDPTDAVVGRVSAPVAAVTGLEVARRYFGKLSNWRSHKI